MAQNTIQNPDNLFLEDVIVYIANYSTALTNDSIASITGASWTNIGSIGELSRETAVETAQPESFNVEHDQVVTKENENINFTVQEIVQANINKLMGATGQAVATSSTETSTNFVIAANTLSVYEPTKYPSQDYAGNATTPQALASTDFTIYQDGSTAAAVPSSAYTIVQLNDGQGNYGLSFVSTASSNVDLTVASSVTYNFTPRSASDLYFGGADEITPFMLWIKATMADNRIIETYYPEVFYVSGGAITDAAQGSGAYKNVNFSLQAREHKSYTRNNRRVYKIERQST